MLTVFLNKLFMCVIFTLTYSVNICVLTMGGQLRWLWLSGSPPYVFTM